MLFSILEKRFGVLFEHLIYLFQISPEKEVFPDDLKIAKVTPIYKAGNSSDKVITGQYRFYLAFLRFAKVLGSYEIVFYALFTCGHYFFQCWFM